MKTLMISLLAGLAFPVLAIDKIELDYRIQKLTFKLESMQAKPDRRIPPTALRDAQGIILLDRTKAGFLFAFEGGSGVVMVRDGSSRQWSPPAFLKANQASLGLQVGGQQSFIVMLLMNTNMIQSVLEGNFSFGGEASGTAGNSSAGAEGSISSSEPLYLVYGDRAGLFGGVAFKLEGLTPDTDADIAYYGQFLSTKEILLEKKGKPSQAAMDLARKLDEVEKRKPE